MIDYIGSLSSLGYSGDTTEGGEEPGGGGAPEWVPEGSTLFMDFENAHYWDGDAEASLDTMLNQNDTYEVSAGRLTTPSSVKLAGVALSRVTDTGGFTIVIEGEFNQTFDNILRLNDADSHDINTFIDGSSGVYVEEGEEFGAVQSSVAYVTNDPMKFALTLTPDKMSVSDRGSETATYALNPELNWFAWDTFVLGEPGSKFKTITVYAPRDDVALPALSTLA